MELFHCTDMIVKAGARFTLSIPKFSASQGLVCLIRGNNGAGKSSFLECVAGLRSPSSGKIAWAFRRPAPDKFELDFRNNVYYLPQRERVFQGLSISDNLDLFFQRRLSTNFKEGLRRRYFPSLQNGDLSRPAETLSKGQRLGVNLCAIERLRGSTDEGVRLAILDEPMAGLDSAGRQFVQGLIRQLAAQGWVIVIAEHSAIDLSGITISSWSIRQLDNPEVWQLEPD